VLEPWLTAEPLHLAVWTEALRPAGGQLLAPLAEVFRGQRLRGRRQTAAGILAEYAADRPGLLADLLADADQRQFALLLPRLQAHGRTVVALLHKELERTPPRSWKDPPLERTWPAPGPALRREVEQAAGLFAERFALCQSLPLGRLSAVAEGLRRCGYRPVRCRPYALAGGVEVAVVWTRDGRDWRLEQGLPADAVRAADVAHGKEGYQPVDVAGYTVFAGKALEQRYAALWARPASRGEQTRLYVGLPQDRHQKMGWQPLKNAGFIPYACQVLRLPGEQRCFSAVWGKASRNPAYQDAFGADEAEYESKATLEKVGVDVCLYPSGPRPSVREKRTRDLEQAERNLKARPADIKALYNRALARYRLAQDDKALEDLSAVIARNTSPAFFGGHQHRALLYARTGQAEKARRELPLFDKRCPNEGVRASVDAQVLAYLGQAGAGLKRLEEFLARHARDGAFLYEAARAYAQVARIVRARQGARAAALVGSPGLVSGALALRDGAKRERGYTERAMALLRQALQQGYRNFRNLETDPDLEPLRGQPGFAEVLRRGHLERAYSAVWHTSATREAAESHGLGLAEHLKRCRQLAAQGYRPVGLSVSEVAAGAGPVTASVWQRPVVPEAARVALARRQANAAVALVQLGRPERVWPLLRHSPYPDLRSYLVQRLGPLGVAPRLLVERLETETDVSARRALILALGELTPEQLPARLRARLVPRLLGWYRSDPDPGIHGAVDWLLRHGKEGPQPRKLDWGQAGALRRIDEGLTWQALAPRARAAARALGLLACPAGRGGLLAASVGHPAAPGPDGQRRWYVNGQGQTLTVLPGPVEFLMGSPGHEPGRGSGERLHQRRIGRSFALATRPVTVAQFQQFRRAHPEVRHSYTRRYSPDPDGPIIAVTWYEAAQYCRWLSEREGVPEEQMCYPPIAEIEKSKDGVTPLKLPPDYLKRTGYRLPTQAEWEYACRAGAVTSRSYGSDERLLDRYAWYAANAADRAWPVGQKLPNDFGLFDMHGNVWTWCQDRALRYPANVAGRVAEDMEDKRYISDRFIRVLRGASFSYRASVVRCASCRFNRPSTRGFTVGVRPARTCR
jgi:formylglycine-generating enzyme required for sulfatase activity